MNLNLDLIGTFITILIIIAIIAVIIFIIWTALLYPVSKKNDIIKEQKKEEKELEQIKINKGMEWNKYKDLVDETDRIRKALFAEKERKEKLLIENQKLKEHNNNLKVVNKKSKKN